jgi:hypothetical protein
MKLPASVFLEVLCQLTVVPTFTQNGAFALALAMVGVTEAGSLARLTFTTQGVVLNPNVVSALQMFAGFHSEQT